jgi:hypothetical protein
MYRSLVYLFVFILTNAARATGDCPLLGPVYPAPKQLPSSIAFNAAKSNFSGMIDEAIHSAKGFERSAFEADTTSFTLQLFSVKDSAPLFQYYYTSPLTHKATTGVRAVDENTVFRIGSVTKLWTVFLCLIEKGNAPFHEPVSKYVPELRAAAEDLQRNATGKDDHIDYMCWEEVTIGELASQLSGIARQCK